MSSGVDELIQLEIERRMAMTRPRWSMEGLRRRKGQLRLWWRAQTVVLAVSVVAGTASGAFAMARVFRTGTPRHPVASKPPLLAPGDRVVFVSDRDGEDEIYAMSLDGSGVVRLTNDPADDRAPVWSPDGSKIAFWSYTEETEGDVYVMDADGGSLVALTTGPDADKDPAWSPDGARIAFTRGNQIYVMNADGSGLSQLTHLPNGAGHAAWSPDGTRIAFNGYPSGAGSIYVMNTDGGGLTRIWRERDPQTADFTAAGSWSPDGRWILFTRVASVGPCSELNVFRIRPDGSGLSSVIRDGRSLAETWSPDGSRIMFDGILGDACINELFVMNADGTGRVRITNGPASNFNGDWIAGP